MESYKNKTKKCGKDWACPGGGAEQAPAALTTTSELMGVGEE